MNTSHKKAISASYILPVLVYVQTYTSIDTDVLLKQLGIRADRLQKSSYFLNATQYIELMRAVLAAVSHRELIDYIIQDLQITQHGLLGLLSLCSVSLRQAVKAAIRFSPLRARLICLQLIEDEQSAHLRVTPAYDLGDVTEFTIEMTLVSLAKAKSQLVNLVESQDTLSVTYAKLDHDSDTIHYHRPYNQLSFPVTELDLKLQQPHQPTYTLLAEQCEARLESDFEKTITERVAEFLAKAQSEFPSLTDTATYLSISTRTLSRKLQQANTSFQTLLDHERLSRAKQLLLYTEMTVTEIAMHLGFTDASHFTKLFKQHLGKTPLVYRRD